MIKALNITKSYKNGTALDVLKGVDVLIEKSQIAAIIGASGAGKSTLLNILGTLEKPDTGEVSIAGENVFKMSEKKLSAFRNKQMGFVFQFHHLLPEFSAAENIMLPALIAGESNSNAKKKAMDLLAEFNLKDRSEHKPSQLSGGEQQRVAVARALINNPAVIFADEPSGNLDSKNAEELHNLFINLKEKYGQTFVIVTHNEHFAQKADVIIKLKDGRIEKNT